VRRKRFREHYEAKVEALTPATRREIMHQLCVKRQTREDVVRDFRISKETLNTLLRLEVVAAESLPEATKIAIAKAITVDKQKPLAVARANRLSLAWTLILKNRVMERFAADLEQARQLASNALRAVHGKTYIDRRGREHSRYAGELHKRELTISRNRRNSKGIFAPAFEFLRNYHPLLSADDRRLFSAFVSLIERTIERRQARSQAVLDRRLQLLRRKQAAERARAVDRAWAAAA
jgi:hypothetical protein